MRAWLQQQVDLWRDNLSEEAEGHILGRGLPERLLRELGIGLVCPSAEAAPDAVFQKRNGPRAGWRRGWLSVPYWSPRGNLVGAEFRRWDGEKGVQEYRLPDAKHTPVFIGMCPEVLDRIWQGGDVWLVEGLFDLSLSHVIPERDVVLACGSARVSRHQINFLARFLGRGAMVHVAFDEDQTGVSHVEGYTDPKTERYVPGVLDRLRKVDVEARHVRYRGGKDPGEIWETGGRSSLKQAFRL